MKARDRKTVGNPGWPNPKPNSDVAEAALRRATQSAYRRAVFYGSKVVIAENGKIVVEAPVPADSSSEKSPAYQEHKLI